MKSKRTMYNGNKLSYNKIHVDVMNNTRDLTIGS